ncbi:GMC oxidoreductase [Williamsia maris]|uniref:Cholesterol oxidase n=1 Tax=Williamsia maris TaxID=72806 RepID=A0ABT1HJF1_9NOCA|nr:GMC oxidoreductase [Williamsia maris]MCP2178071.1 cholesterol oxidase [Williamsia maris]
MTASAGVDVVVIGSGFGGAVTAARLAEGGMSVLVFERGPWWGDQALRVEPGRVREFPRGPLGIRRALRGVRWSGPDRSGSITPYRDGLFELNQFDQLSCLTASGVGGGSLVYTNMHVRAPAPYFDRFPDEITATDMTRYYDKVAAMQRPVPDPFPRTRTATFDAAVASARLGQIRHPDLAIDFAKTGTGSGAAHKPCILGSNDCTKRSLDRTYLAQAIDHGATVRALCEVTALGTNAAGGWEVRFRDHHQGRTHTVTAARVVVAAGTLGTLRILLTARDRHHTLPDLSPALGHGFTPNGDRAALLHRTADSVGSGSGPSISSYVQMRHDDGDYLVAAAGLPLHALPLPGVARRRLDRTMVLFAMGADAIKSEVTLDDRGALRADTARTSAPDVYDQIDRTTAMIAHELSPRRVLINAPFGRRSRRMFTVHPLGGIPIATSRERGVVDHTGQVFDHPGLYVCDGSLLPGAPGIPPAMTIAALAERQSDLILASTTP